MLRRALLLSLALAATADAHPAWQRSLAPAKLTAAQQKRHAYGDAKDPAVSLRDAHAKLARLAARRPDALTLHEIGRVGGQPLVMAKLAAASKRGGPPPVRVLVSAGVHGDEPSGVLAAVDWIGRVVKDRALRERFELVVLPAVNPTGLAARTRHNAAGQDLNRHFPDAALETAAVQRALAGQRFDLFVDLHGSRQAGFFLIRGKDDGGISGRILSAMSSGALLGTPSSQSYAMHTRGGATSSNVGTFKDFMLQKGARYSYTLEYPRGADPAQQRRGIRKLLASTLENVRAHGDLER
jgi:predicted deacylase